MTDGERLHPENDGLMQRVRIAHELESTLMPIWDCLDSEQKDISYFGEPDPEGFGSALEVERSEHTFATSDSLTLILRRHIGANPADKRCGLTNDLALMLTRKQVDDDGQDVWTESIFRVIDASVSDPLSYLSAHYDPDSYERIIGKPKNQLEGGEVFDEEAYRYTLDLLRKTQLDQWYAPADEYFPDEPEFLHQLYSPEETEFPGKGQPLDNKPEPEWLSLDEVAPPRLRRKTIYGSRLNEEQLGEVDMDLVQKDRALLAASLGLTTLMSLTIVDVPEPVIYEAIRTPSVVSFVLGTAFYVIKEFKEKWA